MIPAGGVERFHILVGASKSCNLRLRFKFSIDKNQVVASDEFTIRIWNPRNSGLENMYMDGQELSRRETERKGKKELTEPESWQLDDLDYDLSHWQWNQKERADYLFINPNSKRNQY
jgi:hypothetical protein